MTQAGTGIAAAQSLAGLHDAREKAKLRAGLAAAGLAVGPDGLPGLGFHRCSGDLADELIGALGVDGV